jgi:hypothetical protein
MVVHSLVAGPHQISIFHLPGCVVVETGSFFCEVWKTSTKLRHATTKVGS